MKLTFVETKYFTATVYAYFINDAEYTAFQEAIAANPERGDIIPDCDGLRKTRWRDIRRKKGAQGGLRIIYLYIPEANRVLLLAVYDKDQSTDLTVVEKHELTDLAQAYRDEVSRNRYLKGPRRWKH